MAARAYRAPGVLRPLRDDLAHTHRESDDADGLVPEQPADPTVTRRGVLSFVGAGSLLLVVTTAGHAIGGPARSLALLAPRRENGDGPNGFPVNKTFRGAGLAAEDVQAEAYRLTLRGPAG